MGSSALPATKVFVESDYLRPVYCTGLASAFIDGGNIHFALYEEHIAADGSSEKVIVLRVIMPAAHWLLARDLTEFEIMAKGHGIDRPALMNG